MRTPSLRPLTILPQICVVWCATPRKHLNAILEVFYCFTVRSACLASGDASDYNEDKRSAVAARMQNKVVVESSVAIVRARMEILAALKQLSENKNDAMCVVSLRLVKTNIFNMELLSTLIPHLTELSKAFQAGCFDFALVKASTELCINKFTAAAGKSELNANCGKLDSELIIPIHKKGDRSEWTNYRGISA